MKNKRKVLIMLIILIGIVLILPKNIVFAKPVPQDGGDSNSLSLSVNYINEYLKAFGALAVLAGVAMIGIKLMFAHANPDKRSNVMTGILYIGIGSFILGAGLFIAGLVIGSKNQMMGALNATPPSIKAPSSNSITDDSNFITRAISSLLDAVTNFVFGSADKPGLQKLMGFQSIDQLIFNGGVASETQPFSKTEWDALDYLYHIIEGITAPLLLMMIGVTGFSFIHSANSVTKREEAKESALRWTYVILIIVAGPLFFRGILYLCNLLTNALYYNGVMPISDSTVKNNMSVNSDMIKNIATGNVFTTSIVKIIFCYIDVKVNIVFLARKIMLCIMYAFTPIVACLWGINKRVNASGIWFGELITNASMAFFYGFTYLVMAVMIKASGTAGWFYTIMWLLAMMKIAEMLRNSLQGLFARLSGLDERSLGGNALKGVGAAFGMAAAGTSALVRSGINSYAGSSPTGNLGNARTNSMANGINRSSGISNSNSGNVGNTTGGNTGALSSGAGRSTTIGGNAGTGVSGGNRGASAGGQSRILDTHGNPFPASESSTLSPEQQKLQQDTQNHQKYSNMLKQNYDDEVTKRGQHTSPLGTRGSGITSAVETANKVRNAGIRSKAAGKAINDTVSKMVQDSQAENSPLRINGKPLKNNDAMKILFGKDKTNKNQNSFIRDARINNINGAKQVLASTNPYINADSNLRWN